MVRPLSATQAFAEAMGDAVSALQRELGVQVA